MKNLSIFIGIILMVYSVSAQQITRYSLYNQNLYLINPAAAGSDCNRVLVHHKNQWASINNSPKSYLVAFDGSLNKHGFGVQAQSYSAGLLKDFQIEGTYSYHLPLNEKVKMSAGLSLGIIQQSFLTTNAIASDYTDVILSNGDLSALGMTSSAGIYLYGERFDFGISIPRVFGTRLINVNNTIEYNPVYHTAVYGRYWFLENEKIAVNINTLYKNAQFNANQLDFGSEFWWNKTIGLGAIYRTNENICGVFNFNFKDLILVSYAYDFAGGKSAVTNNGSHEIALNLKLCKKNLTQEPNIEPDVLPEITEDTLSSENNAETVLDTVKIDSPLIIEEVNEVEEEEINVEELNKQFESDDNLIIFEFDNNENIISNNQKRVVDEVIAILKENEELKVTLNGHSCNLGDAGINLTLSRQRAETIKKYMISQGVEADKIMIVAHGENNPMFPNNTQENRKKNRSVLIQFNN